MRQLVFATITAMGLLIAPSTARAGDVEDLKATVLKELKAYSDRDCKTVISLRTDPSVNYNPNNPEPFIHKKAEALKRCDEGKFDNWAQAEGKVVFTPVDYQYLVMGTTGIVYGRLKAESTPKEGSPTTGQHRRLETWVKSNGQWKRAAIQLTPIPSGN